MAIVAALDDELRIVRSRMAIDSRIHIRPALFALGTYGAAPVLLVRSGVGVEAMGRAIGYCLDRFAPSFCLHIGYCGGADPHYQVGDLLIAKAVVDSKTASGYTIDQGVVEQARQICAEGGLRARIGTLVTVGGAIASPHEKAFVGTQYGAQGIDMESSALASACDANGTPYLVVRSVFDPLDHALPDLAGAIDGSGALDRLGLAGRLIRRPRDIFSLPRLQYCAMQARKAISEFVELWQEGSK